MKRISLSSFGRRIAVLTGFAMLTSVGVARAQIEGPVEFATTFPFSVGNTTMPAGSYTITPDDDNPLIVEITGPRTGAFVETQNAQAPRDAKTEVVFKRYGNGYVLKNVWMAGSTTGFETVVMEAERHHIKHGGATGEQRVPATRKGKSSTR